MSRKRKNELPADDDGRTIVDMSGVERPNLFTFRPIRRDTRADEEREQETADERPWEKEKDKLSKADTFRYVVGATAAALLIGAVFIIAAALLILIMIKVMQ